LVFCTRTVHSLPRLAPFNGIENRIIMGI